MCIGGDLSSFALGVMAYKKRKSYKDRFYVRVTEEEKARWVLCAGELGVASWIRQIVNAVTVVEHGLECPSLDRQTAEHIYRNPVWDVELLPPEVGRNLEFVRRERLLEHKKRNTVSRVPLCRRTRLPTFACSCSSCAAAS